MRFILNLKDLNNYLSPPHFQLEDWRTVVQLMTPGIWMATLDLKDAYLLVPISQEDRRFLRFQWRGNTFEFTALPFGLSTAPYIFTKIIRPVLARLRSEGHLSIVYLDDFLLFGQSKNECLDNLNATLSLLTSLGFLCNYSKSQFKPSQVCKFLGFQFNSIDQSISIPPKRRQALLNLITIFRKKSKCRIREFAAIIGSLISVCPAVEYGQIGRAHV